MRRENCYDLRGDEYVFHTNFSEEARAERQNELDAETFYLLDKL